MRNNIYDIFPVRITLGKTDLSRLVEFLTRSTDLILSPSDTQALFKERSMASTPLSKVFRGYVDDGCIDRFSLLAFPPRSTLHIPEGLTHRHITLDMDQVATADPSVSNTIRANHNLRGKIITNVTQVVRTDGRYFYLKDHDRFQSQVVRDCLSHSFYVSKNNTSWLRNSVLLSMARTYALLLGNNISSWLSLDQGSQDYITIVFALYFLGQCSDPRNAVGILLTKHRDFYIRDREVIKLVLERFSTIIGGEVPDTFDECFRLIDALEIPRLSVSRPELTAKLRTIAEDAATTPIALEYPPYFVWAVLNALGGAKNQLNIFIKRQQLMKDLQRATGELLQRLPALS